MEKSVKMAPRKVLLSIAFIEALAEAVRNLGLTRRPTINEMADILLAWISAGGTVLDWEGKPIDGDDIVEHIYGNDASGTWPSTLKRVTKGSRKRAPRATIAMRLGLYELGFRLIGKPIIID